MTANLLLGWLLTSLFAFLNRNLASWRCIQIHSGMECSRSPTKYTQGFCTVMFEQCHEKCNLCICKGYNTAVCN